MKQTYSQIFFRFLRFGFLAWGGPVAQIAMIKKELVEDEQWVDKDQFNRALAVYQALPGPEAHELCVYFGMKAAGRWGGFLAGLGFMLPGFLLMLLFTWIYIRYGISSPIFQSIFSGIQIAVIALIAFAVYRIGKHAVTNTRLLAISFFSAAAFYFGIHFLIILLAGGIVYTFLLKKNIIALTISMILFFGWTGYSIYTSWQKIDEKGFSRTMVPKKESTHRDVFLTGLKGGLLSFGGAYTAIPIIQEDAVNKKQWMSQEQFLDGIALSGILPAPLIIFSTFVGYFGGGWWGAILITIGVFLPAFSFTLIGHSIMEKLIANKGLHDFLDGITAAVVGLIGITAILLMIEKLSSIISIVIFVLSLFLLIKFRSKYAAMLIIIIAGILSFAYSNFF